MELADLLYRTVSLKGKDKGTLAIHGTNATRTPGKRSENFEDASLEEGVFIFSIYWPISPDCALKCDFCLIQKMV